MVSASPLAQEPKERLRPVPLGPRHQHSRLDTQGMGELPQYRDARRRVSAFDRADVTGAKAHTVRQILLRHLLGMAESTHIGRHDLFEIHDDMALDVALSFQER